MTQFGRDDRARLAVAEERLNAHASEIQRMRERIHMVEGDRQAIRLAVKSLNSLRHDIPELARRVAEETIEAALANRDALHRQRSDDRRAGLSFRAQLVFGALSALLVLLALYDRFG